MTVRVDAAGNLRGATRVGAGRAGSSSARTSTRCATPAPSTACSAWSSAIALVELLEGAPLPFAIEVVGFSEEEGVRFGVPVHRQPRAGRHARRALLDATDDDGSTVREAIAVYGLDAGRTSTTPRSDRGSAISSSTSSRDRCSRASTLPLGVVDAIAGQIARST